VATPEKKSQSNSGKVGAGLLGAGAGAILTYFLTHGRTAQAAPPEGNVLTPDEETWNLLVGILQGIVDLNAKADALSEAINNLTVSLGGDISLKNPEGGVAAQVFNQTAGVAIQLPDYPVPWDKEVVIKALNGNAQPCRVGFSKIEAQDVTLAWPLLRNEAKGWKVDNANRLWVCFIGPTDGVAWSVEKGR
jgi:hypothetical protein